MMIYLDHAASSPLRPAARVAWNEAVDLPGNAASPHAFGRRAAQRVAEARQAVAQLVARDAQEVYFTASGTEANNLAILGLAAAVERNGGIRRAAHSALEHSCVRGPMASLAARGWDIEVLPVSPDGQLLIPPLQAALARGLAWVSVMAVSNEVGALQRFSEWRDDVRRAGSLLHVDAVQGVGLLDPRPWDADLLSVSAHKLGGGQGVGALVLREGVRLEPVLRGGPHERGVRPGTLAVAAIAAFGAAASEAFALRDTEAQRLTEWRERLERQLLVAVPGLRVLGAGGPRAPHILSLTLPGATGRHLVEQLDLVGVAVSTGAACTSLKQTPNPTLQALGLTEAEAQGSLRISLGWTTTADELERAGDAIASTLRAMTATKPMRVDHD
ncbi:MAG: cysteine desulfurase family protein [Candidatus Sericytochromatia bacterium]|nr:cysteine desulfurase family protein [Candidatus Sericytochromatia bacterium]